MGLPAVPDSGEEKLNIFKSSNISSLYCSSVCDVVKERRESNGNKLITFLNRSIEKSIFNLVFCFVFLLL